MNVCHKEDPRQFTFLSSRFGPLSVTPDKIISFVQSIPGFEKLKRFILLDHGNEGLFKWLQSVEDPKVAFLLTDPNLYKPGYAVPLKKWETEGLGVKDAKALVTFVMVCVSGENRLSINLKGPVVFNSENMRAIQCVIDKDEYMTHFAIN